MLYKQLCLPLSFQHRAQQEDIKKHSQSQCDPPHIQLREGAEKKGGASIIQGVLGRKKGRQDSFVYSKANPRQNSEDGLHIIQGC